MKNNNTKGKGKGMFTVKITALTHNAAGVSVSTEFTQWQNAVDYACSFEKSPNYHVAMYHDGYPVSYYSNQDTINA